MKNDELFHSSTYYGKDVSDGLRHWKYVKRYKGKNGKWVYVYKDGSSSVSTKNGGTTKTDVKNNVFNTNDGKFYDEVKKEYRTNTDQWFDSSTTFKSTYTTDDGLTRNFKSTYVTYGKLHVARMNTERAISSIAESTISKGKSLIKKLFGK